MYGIGHDEPQHDGQMERDEDLGGGVRTVRIEVDHERSEHERHRQQHPVPGSELPSAGEVPGKERQHEQTGVSHQPVRLLVGGVSSEACNLHHDGRSEREAERLEPAARPARRLVVTAQEKLFPQSAAVLACELPGQGVDVS